MLENKQAFSGSKQSKHLVSLSAYTTTWAVWNTQKGISIHPVLKKKKFESLKTKESHDKAPEGSINLQVLVIHSISL
jgi:hypothetical protein